ncbi:TetR/AcrR family transcriptional regulator [Brevundimonas sp.]|uniref:TetR/AcrR family transcriptional regulator n=1 Tax=Brevundimonas sp. TaxID=1871086 RepID=UPI003561DFCB
MTIEPEGPRPPRQKRSEATLARILDAARALLATRDLDDITVEDIAREAGVSVGTLYTRFKSKDELLTHLLDATQRGQVQQLAEVLAAERWTGVDLAARLAWLVETLQASARSNPGLIRAVFGRLLSQSAALNAGPAALNARSVALISDWLLAAEDGVRAPDPATAAATTTAWLSYSVHMAMLYSFAFPGQDGEAVARELQRAALAALRPDSGA